MITATKTVKAKKLRDGDIFYTLVNSDWNSHFLDTTMVGFCGNDMIFIADDCGTVDKGSILVNGGRMLYLEPDQKVVVLGHYGKLIGLERIKKLLLDDSNNKQ